MPLIRKLEITNFRGIQSLRWLPAPGLNALIGPGDSCKSSILDAIDWCLGLRRSIMVNESDFFQMDTSRPIRITATMGLLPPELMSLSRFGECLRGFTTGATILEAEPHADCESVIQLVLKIEGDLEPHWYVVKHDGDDEDILRLTWSQRQLLAPVRIGSADAYHLSWRRNSALAKLTDGNVSASEILSNALRDARNTFAASPPDEVEAGLALAKKFCEQFAVADIDEVKAGLDVDAVGAGVNCVSLHDQSGVPLRLMGTGSVRLLSSALVASVASHSLMLIDELEHGLEPHRIIRLLHAIGSKAKEPQQQVFLTTHSPVAVSELTVTQLWIVRQDDDGVSLRQPPGELQGTVRSYPNALLAKKVLVCEGASEVGLIRGLDIYLTKLPAKNSLAGGLLLHGLAIVDGRGSSTAANALSLIKLGYPAAMLRDSDVVKKKPKDKDKWDVALKAEDDFVAAGGKVFCWSEGLHTEAAVFRFGTDANVQEMVDYAKNQHGEDAIERTIGIYGKETKLSDIETALLADEVTADHRSLLGLCANKGSWFKRTDHYEFVSSEILLPTITANSVEDAYLRNFLRKIAKWCTE